MPCRTSALRVLPAWCIAGVVGVATTSRALDHAAGGCGRRRDRARCSAPSWCRGCRGRWPNATRPAERPLAASSPRQWSTCSRALPTSWHSARSTRKCSGWSSTTVSSLESRRRARAPRAWARASSCSARGWRCGRRSRWGSAQCTPDVSTACSSPSSRSIPLAAFELVSPLPVAAQALEGAQRSAARLSAVLDQPASVIEPAVAKATRPGPHHDLRVRGLRVRHAPDAPWAVDGVDLDLSEGRRVALVGASGAGKSTIAAALVRFVDYESGSVRLDGTELRDCDGDQVRQIVGLVEQDAHIFDSTLRENMRLAKPTASDAEIMAALARARLSDWVTSLPLGLDTAVGEHGSSLSGGQRQRLALARALLADFPILVLDEPGEHLDAETADALDARPAVRDDRSHHAADHPSPRRARVGRRDRGARPRSRRRARWCPP